MKQQADTSGASGVIAQLDDASAVHRLTGVANDVRLAEPCTIPAVIAQLLATAAHRPALAYYRGTSCERRLTYAALLELAAGHAGYLRDRVGISPGDRVALLSPNRVALFAAALGVMALGAVAVPVNDKESDDAIRYVIEHAGARALIVAEGAAAPRLPGVSLHTFEELASGPARDARAELTRPVAPDALAVIVYTSGTTARPKGVCLSHYNLCVNAEALRRIHALGPGTTTLCVLPLCFMNAFGFSLVATLYAGARVVLCDELAGPVAWSIMAAERVHVASLVPSLLRLLLLRPRRAADLPELSHVISAAAPLEPSLARAFHDATAVPIRQGYGLTETTNFSTTMPGDLAPATRERLMYGHATPSIGAALHGCELAIWSDAGEPVPDGSVGEIVIRGHSVMRGYHRDPAASRDAFRGGWFHTGDLGYATRVGEVPYYFITGRAKELIIRNGRNLSPLAIERELGAARELGAFAVVGIDNIHVGEEVAVYVCGADTSERRQRLQALVARSPEIARPRFAMLSEQPIPTTRMGKVQRRRLATRFAACAALIGKPRTLQFVASGEL